MRNILLAAVLVTSVFADTAIPRAPGTCDPQCGQVKDAFSTGACISGKCTCIPGWSGTNCQSATGDPAQATSLNCHPRCGTGVFWKTGTCDSSTSTCVCLSGWKGVFCGESANPEINLGTGMAQAAQPIGNVTAKTDSTGTGADNVCLQYPITNTTPQRCGRAFLVRCPMGQCCSNSGFCGGGVLVTSSRIKRRYGVTDWNDLSLFYDMKNSHAHIAKRFDDDHDSSLFARTDEVCYRAMPEWTSIWNLDDEVDVAQRIANLKRGLPPHHGTPFEKRTSGTTPPTVCKRLTLEERTNSCKRTNDCCGSTAVCSRMSKIERRWWCDGKNACCRCPPNPYDPIQFCGEGCQVGFGKCWQTTSTAVCPTTTISPTTSGTVMPTTSAPPASTTTGQASQTTSVTATTSVTPSSGSVYGVLSSIASGQTAKTYSVTGFKNLLDQFSDLKNIANGGDTNYPNITLFAWTNDAIAAWVKAGGPGKTKRERLDNLESRQSKFLLVSRTEHGERAEQVVDALTQEEEWEKEMLQQEFATYHHFKRQSDFGTNAKQFISYSFLPLTVNPGTLPAKALAKTLLTAGALAKVDTQYMVLTKTGSTIYPFFGASNSTVIDSISCSNGILFVVSTVINPPIPPSNTIAQVSDLTDFNAALNSLNLASQLNGYGVPDSGSGITILGIINDFWDASFTDTWNGYTTDQRVTLINYNVLNGVYYSYQLVNGATIDTLLPDNTVTVGRTTSGGVTTVTIDDNPLVILDVLTRNGVLHLMNGACIPAELLPQSRLLAGKVKQNPKSSFNTLGPLGSGVSTQLSH